MFYFLKNIIMGKKTNILTTIATATVISTTSVNADTLKDNDINKIVCTTKQSCEKLSNSIQAQIKKIEGKTNLTKKDKRERYTLKKQLIALEKAETQTEINETNNNNDIIKTNTKQIKEQLTSIKGSFL